VASAQPYATAMAQQCRDKSCPENVDLRPVCSATPVCQDGQCTLKMP
jgi:hypothetical protein